MAHRLAACSRAAIARLPGSAASSVPALVRPAALAARTPQLLAGRQLAGARRLSMAMPENTLVGADRPPSPKQLDYAARLAAQHSQDLPEEAKQSSITCSAFIDRMLEEFPNPPTDKQIAFATRLCAEKGVPMRQEAMTDKRKISEFIDELMGNAPGGGESAAGEPTSKQLIFAASLARERRLGLSAEVLASRQAMSAFIESNGGGASRMPGGSSASPSGEGAAAGWEPPPSAPYPPPLEQRDDSNRGRYPY